MILSKKPVTLAEVGSIVPKSDEKKPIHDYLKKYLVLSKDKADKLIGELRALNNLKLKEEHFVKIVDFLPKSQEDLNKLVAEANLSEAEANAILEITNKY